MHKWLKRKLYRLWPQTYIKNFKANESYGLTSMTTYLVPAEIEG